jgi:hypothetical protein
MLAELFKTEEGVRSLRRLVAIELKMGSFDAAYKGHMEFSLCWLDRYERWPGEEPLIRLILRGESNRWDQCGGIPGEARPPGRC